MINRQSNFELLRIICMLMVVGGHILISQSKMTEIGEMDYYIGNIYRSFAISAVDVFILITGYFGIHFDVRKIMRIQSQVFFYSLSIFLICCIIQIHQIEIKKDVLLVFPIIFQRYWFITIYVLLLLICPLINRILKQLNQNQYTFLVLLICIVFYVWPTISYSVAAPAITKDSGYGIVNFVMLYIFGRYIHKCLPEKYISIKIWFILLILSIGLMYSANSMMTYFLGFYYQQYISYDSIFCLFVAVSLFMLFRSIKFKSNIINFLAKNCFATYIIHAHPIIWNFYWAKDTGIINHNLHGIELILWLLFVPMGIYIVCWFFEEIRIMMFRKVENMLLNKLCGLKFILGIQKSMESLEGGEVVK